MEGARFREADPVAPAADEAGGAPVVEQGLKNAAQHDAARAFRARDREAPVRNPLSKKRSGAPVGFGERHFPHSPAARIDGAQPLVELGFNQVFASEETSSRARPENEPVGVAHGKRPVEAPFAFGASPAERRAHLPSFAGQELKGECMLGCKEFIRSRAEGFLGFGREFGLACRTKREAVKIH